MPKVNLSDIAEKLGVSTATVSRALRNKPGVNPQLREAIFKMAQSLNYPFTLQENSSALQKVGVVVPDLSNPFFATVCYGIDSVLRPSGFLSVLVNTDEDRELESEYVIFLFEDGVMGLIAAPSAGSREVYAEWAERMPLVFFDRCYDIPGSQCVLVDNKDIIFQVVRFLVEQGHREICLVGGDEEIYTGRMRTEGFLEAVKLLNLDPQSCRVVPGQFKEPESYAATKQVLESERCTAVIATSNKTTLGALRAIRELGLRIPEEVSLVGFDEPEWMAIYEPAITTAVQPAFSMRTLAASLLLQSFNSSGAREKVVLKAEIVHRQSVVSIG